MDDEVLTGAPALVGVVHARVYERLLDPIAVDRRGPLVRVLLDDREQLGQEPPLVSGQLGALDLRVGLRMLDAVDRTSRGNEQRGAVAVLAGRRNRSVLLPAPGQPPGR
jgi:hypothetical protein